MRVLVVSRYKIKLAGHVAPFVREQVEAIRKRSELPIEDYRLQNEDLKVEVELFLLRGSYWQQWKSLREKIREWKPDVIHAHYGLSGLLANLATRCVPVVCTYHGSDINLTRVRPFSKAAMRLSAWNIFVCRKTMEKAGVTEGNKCSLIPCGVSLIGEQLMTREEARKVLGWSKTDKKVLFAGAFDNAVKNAELAIQAMNELTNERIDDAELIELKGYTREEVSRLMCGVNCLLMTSKTEGSPQVIKEAMACGCPIVSVDVGDVAERLNGLEGCFVVPIDDRSLMIDQLAEALEKAIAFEGKTKGRERVMKDGLTNEQVAERIVEAYERIRKPNPSPSLKGRDVM